MKLPVTCEACTCEGELESMGDELVVIHDQGACRLPPRVKTVPVPRDRYPSPWKMKLRGW